MKKLERKWKRIITWTALIYMILLVLVLRLYWNNSRKARSWGQDPNIKPTQRLPHISPSRPDTRVAEVNTEELSGLLRNASDEWKNASPEKQERALESRMEELSAMEPERVEGVVNHLLDLSGVEAKPEKRVELAALDLSTAVPVNMRESVNEKGESGVWMELQDKEGQVAELWVLRSDLSPEELQAMRAFEIMNRLPALHKLRPLMTPLMR